MSFDDAVNAFDNKARKKKLDSYHDGIVNWLREYTSLRSTQVYNWLLAHFPKTNVLESTVRQYVIEMREIYQIEKIDAPREYEAVDEQLPGKQIQVAF